jgi:predicted MPP superfamily phosphohydrolase
LTDIFLGIPLCIGGTAIFILFILLARAVYEPFTLESTRIRLACQPEPEPRSGPDATPLRITFFSDLHANICPLTDRKLLSVIFSEPADVILFGGDISSRTSDPGKGLDRLRQIAEEARKRGIPCFGVRGNHDLSISSDMLASSGFLFLENDSVSVKSSGGVEYLITGLTDSGRDPRVWPPVPPLEEDDVVRYPLNRRICLVHNPEYVVHKSGLPYKYQLSGHFHGGQIYMPFHLEYKLFRSETIASEGIYKGVFQKNGIVGYITRGVGCVLFPLRLFSKPEISHITLSS